MTKEITPNKGTQAKGGTRLLLFGDYRYFDVKLHFCHIHGTDYGGSVGACFRAFFCHDKGENDEAVMPMAGVGVVVVAAAFSWFCCRQLDFCCDLGARAEMLVRFDDEGLDCHEENSQAHCGRKSAPHSSDDKRGLGGFAAFAGVVATFAEMAIFLYHEAF